MVNILYCGNEAVFDGFLTSALSVLKRTDSKEPFCFYLFTMDVSHLKENYVPVTAKQLEFFDKVVKSYNKDNQVKLFDVTNFYMEHFSGCPNEGAYCSPYTLIRLFADLIPEIPDKLLYLDADIMFNSALIYELAVLRNHATPLLDAVHENREEFCLANALSQFLSFFEPISDTELPPTSLLREFLGGSSFKY